ncbi:hypothetical protein KC330_g151 [Hortaea werneckii]|nr:hypothetical protein KC330_g151 [Hortaea werneckii]
MRLFIHLTRHQMALIIWGIAKCSNFEAEEFRSSTENSQKFAWFVVENKLPCCNPQGDDVVCLSRCAEAFGEGACEFADTAFGKPVPSLIFGYFGTLVGLLGSLACRPGICISARHRRGVLVLNRRLLVFLAALYLCALLALDESCWTLPFFATMLGTTLDGQGLAVGELDVDVLLLNAGQLAM